VALLDDQRRLLELQWIKVQREAMAARLEARAAELEIMIRQLASGQPGSLVVPPATLAPVKLAPVELAPVELAPVELAPVELAAEELDEPATFSSWDDVRSTAGKLTKTEEPHVDASARAGGERAPPDGAPIQLLQLPKTARPEPISVSPPLESREKESGEHALQRRARPTAWLSSAAAHAVGLFVLALCGLQAQRPKDQVALSASVAEAREVTIETFAIESAEPEAETSEQAPSETEYELSPVGELAAARFAPEVTPSLSSPAAASLSSDASVSAAAMSLRSDSAAKIQFCGVEGGGNHFVYLVDSSGSMGESFESARAELLRSIDALQPDQRFYVVFFDAQPDFMRLSNSDQDEPHSVLATPQNKAALRRWAMRVAMDRGLAPYEPLRFALGLKPDVIFLLSDGEFPEGIEDLLRQQNRVENLFGDRGPISIVHTIGYHSEQGMTRMRRIAEQNQGQYRSIPKP
jgi:hypothetical protein